MLTHLSPRTVEQSEAAVRLARLFAHASARLSQAPEGDASRDALINAVKALLELGGEGQANGIRAIHLERLLEEHRVLAEIDAQLDHRQATRALPKR